MKHRIRAILEKFRDPHRIKREWQRRLRIAYAMKMGSWFRDKPYFFQSRMDIDEASPWYDPSFNKQVGGGFSLEKRDAPLPGLEAWDQVRSDMLRLLLRTIDAHDVTGDIVEVGVYRGLTAKLLHYYFPERTLHLFDTFTGFAKQDLDQEEGSTETTSPHHFSDTSVKTALDYIAPMNDRVKVYPGLFPNTIPDYFNNISFAFVHLDADLYAPTIEGLRYFYPRMSPGGMILVHDYNAWPGARQAVDEFFKDKAEVPIPMPDKSGSALIVKNKFSTGSP